MNAVSYFIDGKEVTKEEFEILKGKLTVDQNPKYSAPIEANPDDPTSYPQGSEVAYEAIEKSSSKKFTYREIIYPKEQVFEIISL